VTAEESLTGLDGAESRRKLYETGIDDELMGVIAAANERAWPWAQRLMEQYEPAANVVAVSHDVTIAALVCQTLAMPLDDFRRFRIDLGSITVLDLRPGRLRLLLLNDTHHMDG
jgi:broad specificity phosphatase PhoE